MTDYNRCHGPRCHKQHTQDRIRGVKGSKVLRTRKIKLNQWTRGAWGFFCSQGCQNDFWKKHATEIVAIAPRTEALETPILNPERKTHTYHYGMDNQYSYDRTETKIEVDNTRSTDVG